MKPPEKTLEESPGHILLEEALELSKEAADGTSKRVCAWSRPSMIGKPAIDLALVLLSDAFPSAKTSPKLAKKVLGKMRQQLGFVWEAASIEILQDKYPSFQFRKSHKAVYSSSLKGTIDILGVDEENKKLMVVDAKCLGSSTKKDGMFWLGQSGYPTQLAVYAAACMKDPAYRDYDVSGYFHLMARNSWKEYLVNVKDVTGMEDWIGEGLYTAQKNTNFMLQLESAILEKETDTVVSLFMDALEEAPLKEPFYANYIGVCNFHYHPIYQELCDEAGFVKDAEEAERFIRLCINQYLS